MQTIIKNNTPAYLDTETIQKEINTLKVDYMNSNIQILKVTATQSLALEGDQLTYELLIWDSSEEPLHKIPEDYMDAILDYIDYAEDYDCSINANIEIISREEKLSKITLTLTF